MLLLRCTSGWRLSLERKWKHHSLDARSVSRTFLVSARHQGSFRGQHRPSIPGCQEAECFYHTSPGKVPTAEILLLPACDHMYYFGAIYKHPDKQQNDAVVMPARSGLSMKLFIMVMRRVDGTYQQVYSSSSKGTNESIKHQKRRFVFSFYFYRSSNILTEFQRCPCRIFASLLPSLR